MSQLEIRRPEGPPEFRKLSRRSPMIVGRNPISDLAIDDESVAPVHCRLSWNGKGFEIAAVVADGVDVNGVLVRRKELTEGDVIRVGDIDLVLLNGSDENAATASPVDPGPRRADPGPPQAPTFESPATDDVLEALTDGEIEIPIVEPAPRRTKPKPEPRGGDDLGLDGELPVLPIGPPSEPQPALHPHPAPEPKPAPAPKPATEPKPPSRARRPPRPGFWSRLRPRRRPGEQEATSSPLVLTLGGLSLALLLAAGAIWLLIGREGADRLFEAAAADREAGRFADAIAGYEQFLKDYGRDERAADVRYDLGRTRVERYTAGASADWAKAVQEFDAFARANRNEPDFENRRESLLQLAESVAAGAAANATRTGERESLAAAEEGRKLFNRYAPADGSSSAVGDRLAKAYAAAEAAVRKREYFDAAATKIETALAKPDLALVFETRADLLNRYPDLASNKRVQSLLGTTLEAEKKLVRPIEPIAPPTSPRAEAGQPPVEVLTLVGHTQARAGEVSDGRLVFMFARDALIGLDAVTGRPRWRRSVGLDPPFAPVEVDASVPALLTFDASRNDLLLIARQSGDLLWRAPAGSLAAGPPLVTQGQIDLPTRGGRLLRFSLDSGQQLAETVFPQDIVGPPVLADGGERIVVFGDRATAYTLDLRSLNVLAVSFTGHTAGAIEAPPASLGKLIVTCENDRLASATVRAFAVDAESGSLRQVASERLEGRTRQPLVTRGNVLFIPMSPERITAFSVSDDPAQSPLTRLASLPIPEGQDLPVFLVPGPEGMLWQAGSALRKLRLAPDGLELLPGAIAPGRHTQPPQESAESLFVARSLASSPAVYMSQADREAMTGSWRTAAGASVLVATIGGGAATVVTDAGQSAVVTGAGARFIDAVPLPRWDEAAPEPLLATTLFDGRVAAWRGGKAPLLWLLRPGDDPPQPRPLAAEPECLPVALDGGLVLPLPGRLEWLPEGGSPLQAFLLSVGGEGEPSPKWRSLARLDGDRFAVLDDAGTLRVIATRREPLPHLAEIASATLDGSSRPIDAAGERIVVAADHRVRLLDPAGLRPVAEVMLDGPVTGGPWIGGSSIFVQTGSSDVVALEGDDLAERWRVALGAPAAGGPVQTERGWVVASQEGVVLTVDEQGTETVRRDLGEALTGLHDLGGTLFAASLGGSLHALPRTTNEGAAAGPGESVRPEGATR